MCHVSLHPLLVRLLCSPRSDVLLVASSSRSFRRACHCLGCTSASCPFHPLAYCSLVPLMRCSCSWNDLLLLSCLIFRSLSSGPSSHRCERYLSPFASGHHYAPPHSDLPRASSVSAFSVVPPRHIAGVSYSPSLQAPLPLPLRHEFSDAGFVSVGLAHFRFVVGPTSQTCALSNLSHCGPISVSSLVPSRGQRHCPTRRAFHHFLCLLRCRHRHARHCHLTVSNALLLLCDDSSIS